MARAEGYRQLVEARAGGTCEYCRLLQAATGVTFHIEHFVPRSRGGLTIMSNLVLSCPGCNLAKADRTTGQHQCGHAQSLFNPRACKPGLLRWYLLCEFHRQSGIMAPRTSTV